VIRVEVMLENSVEIYNLPGIPNLDWTSNNLISMQIVYDDLKRRAICDGLDLTGLQISARNPEWKSEWNDNLEHWL
jgi:hypothetical protein